MALKENISFGGGGEIRGLLLLIISLPELFYFLNHTHAFPILKVHNFKARYKIIPFMYM